jgi:hypothetical protein
MKAGLCNSLSNIVSRKVGRSTANIGINTVIAATLVSATAGSAAAAPFTLDQCRIVSATVAEVVRSLGADTLSVEFRTSLRDFIMTDGHMTCGGPRLIRTPTTNDIAAFNTIRSQLLASNISLQAAGLQSVGD